MMWGNRGRGNKYGRTKVEIDNIIFASKLEARCYEMLKLMQAGNLLKIVELQPNIHLTEARILYKPDFKIFDLEINEPVFIEAKGFETPDWKIKLRLWKHYGPALLRVYKAKGKHLILADEIRPAA